MKQILKSLMILSIVINPFFSNSQQFQIPQGWFQKEEIRNRLPPSLRVFEVEQKEVDWRPRVEGKVPTMEYQSLLREKEKLQPHYQTYIEQQRKDSILSQSIQQIKNKIESYLSTKNKTLLEEAQRLADSNSIEVITTDTNPKYRAWANKPKIEIKLYDGKRYATKKRCQLFLQTLKQIVPSSNTPNYLVKEYLSLLEDEKEIQKWKKGKVLSEETVKRNAYILSDERSYESISGTFTKIDESLTLAKQSIEGIALRGELYTNEDSKGKWILLEEVNTGRLIALNSKEPFKLIQSEMGQQGIKDFLKAYGYSTHSRDYELYINTKYYEVKADKFLQTALRSNPKVLVELDTHYTKIKSLYGSLARHSKTLREFVRLYRLKGINTPTNKINQWISATREAQRLNDQLVEIDQVKFPLSQYYPIDNNYASHHDDFYTYLSLSIEYLGL